MKRIKNFFAGNWKKVVSALAVSGIAVFFVTAAINDPPAERQSSRLKKRVPAEVRIRAAKAELDAVRSSRSKDGKPGKLSVTDLAKPEIVLPVALALAGDDLADLGIDKEALAKEIKAHPEEFGEMVPEHWRPRFLLLTRELEKRLGEKAEKELLSRYRLYKDEKAQKRVNAIAEKIIAVLPSKPSLKVHIIKNDTVNACCLPNGTVFVHSALLEQVGNDDELASVIAHEYAHFVARHSNEMMTKAAFATAGNILAKDKSNKMAKEGKKWRALFMEYGYAGAVSLGFNLPYSRKMESEADTLGIRYMKRAGFDPQGAVASLRHIADRKSSAWLAYFSTHPADENRIAAMQKECDALQGKKKTGLIRKKLSDLRKLLEKKKSSHVEENGTENPGKVPQK